MSINSTTVHGRSVNILQQAESYEKGDFSSALWPIGVAQTEVSPTLENIMLLKMTRAVLQSYASIQSAMTAGYGLNNTSR